jgi:hypothetical protein
MQAITSNLNGLEKNAENALMTYRRCLRRGSIAEDGGSSTWKMRSIPSFFLLASGDDESKKHIIPRVIQQRISSRAGKINYRFLAYLLKQQPPQQQQRLTEHSEQEQQTWAAWAACIATHTPPAIGMCAIEQ